MSKFKQGDRVRVVRKTMEGCSWDWVESMDRYMNRIGIVDVRENGVAVLDFGDGSRYGFAETALELEEVIDPEDDRKAREEAEGIIRDAMRFRALLDKRSTGRTDVCIVRRNWTPSSRDEEWEMLFDDTLLKAVDEHMEKLAKLD